MESAARDKQQKWGASPPATEGGQPPNSPTREPRSPGTLAARLGCTAAFFLDMFVLGIPGSRFRKRHFRIAFKTSTDHLLIQDSHRLSIDNSGIVTRKTAVETRGRRLATTASPRSASAGPMRAATSGPGRRPVFVCPLVVKPEDAHAMPCHAMPCHAMPCRVVSCRVASRRVALCGVM